MNVHEAAGIVLVITQAVKQFLRKWIDVSGTASVILAIVVSAGVTAYKFVSEGLPFNLFAVGQFLIAVIIEANGGKLILKSIFKPK